MKNEKINRLKQKIKDNAPTIIAAAIAATTTAIATVLYLENRNLNEDRDELEFRAERDRDMDRAIDRMMGKGEPVTFFCDNHQKPFFDITPSENGCL